MKIQKNLITVVAFFFFSMALAVVPAPAAAESCESLSALTPADTTITLAVSVSAGPFVPPGATVPINLPAFCRVVAVAKPTSDSVINFEVWLPTTGWNGRFQGVGNGAFGGSINYAAMGTALNRSYATASTDSGHQTASSYDGSWGIGHPEKVVDWGYRAIHEMTVAAKAITEAYYGEAPQYSYFTGCSGGGIQGHSEAQRFPLDYDGILAGSSGHNETGLHAMGMAMWNATNIDPASQIPLSKLPMITEAALAACDALDGVVDGIITDPRRCNFDASRLLCRGGDRPDCLTAHQLDAIQLGYNGVRNPRTEELIYPGFSPGSEIGWSTLVVGVTNPPVPPMIDIFRAFVYEDMNWDWRFFDFDHDMAFSEGKISSIVNAVSPDLRAFKALGGKLLMYLGTLDNFISMKDEFNYYDRMAYFFGCSLDRDGCDYNYGLEKTQEFALLFMAPGMQHCLGGPGPNSFGQPYAGPPLQLDAEHDALSALVQWVEQGVAPKKIMATKYVNDVPAQGVLMTRPLCPYPQWQVYTGHGSTDDPANFDCRYTPTNDRDKGHKNNRR